MTVCASNETQALEIIRSTFKTEGPFTTDLLSGGLSGSDIIKVNTSSQDYVVRFWNMQWAEWFPQDLSCQIIASDAGYGPRVFFADEVACVTVIEYFHPEAFPETNLKLQALADLLKRIHTGPVVPKGVDKSTDLDESIEAVVKLNPRFLDLRLISAIKEAVFTAIYRNAGCIPCHRDLHPGNLIYAQDRFFAIDYTWGGMDDPYTDLAVLAIFNCATQEEERLLLQLYLGRAPTRVEIARLCLMKLPAKIFYGLEFLKLSPASLLSCIIKPVVASKSYLNFGLHGGALVNPTDCFEYAVSLFNEVEDYACSEQYDKDLALFQTA